MSKTKQEWITPAAAPLQRLYWVIAISQKYQNFKNQHSVCTSHREGINPQSTFHPSHRQVNLLLSLGQLKHQHSVKVRLHFIPHMDRLGLHLIPHTDRHNINTQSTPHTSHRQAQHQHSESDYTSYLTWTGKDYTSYLTQTGTTSTLSVMI